MSSPLDLPMTADRLVPHRSPMCIIDRLTEYQESRGVIESTIAPDSMFVRDDGSIEPIVLVELIAQAFAAFKGYGDLLEGKPVGKGFLVEVKRFEFLGTVYGGERLSIAIRKVGETVDFVLGEGKVMRNEEILASGNVMVWVPKDI